MLSRSCLGFSVPGGRSMLGGKNRKLQSQETPLRSATAGNVLKETELPPGRVTDTSNVLQNLGESQRRVCLLCRWKRWEMAVCKTCLLGLREVTSQFARMKNRTASGIS